MFGCPAGCAANVSAAWSGGAACVHQHTQACWEATCLRCGSDCCGVGAWVHCNEGLHDSNAKCQAPFAESCHGNHFPCFQDVSSLGGS